MRDYNAHFSFFSEQWGNFDDIRYTVQANDQFEAREKAWEHCDKDEDTPFRNCIRLYAVTWQPNPLDAGDYFYAQAAYCKQSLEEIRNVKLPNDRIENDKNKQYLDMELAYCRGALQTVDAVAKDLYGEKGILPPSIHEELHYAEKLYDQLGYDEKADELWRRIEQAKEWDSGSMFSLRELFKDGYTTICGETEFFMDYFKRDGVYPKFNKLNDSDYIYVNRMKNTVKIESLNRLPMLQEKAVIPNSSNYMNFEGFTLVMDKSHFKEEYRTPENMLWWPTHGNGCKPNAKGRSVWADNPITGESVAFYREDFLGVLRPEIANNVSFEKLKAEYAVAHVSDNSCHTEVGDIDFDAEPDDEEELEL